jgi:protein gp37
MGTHIEWTDETWNPVSGCTKVSAGCDHCYIERTPPFRMEGRKFDKPGIGGTTGVRLHPDRLEKPLHWRNPRRVFVNSLSDLFHDDVPSAFIASVFDVMRRTPQHTYQILTKRPARMRALLNSWAPVTGRPPWVHTGPWPLPNVWLGASVEDQAAADLRIPKLLETPAAVRFLSCEPLLGPVDLFGAADRHGHRPKLTYWLTGRPGWSEEGEPVGDSSLTLHSMTTGPRIDWVIAGGESGPGARPMHPEWARSLRDQCTQANVAFHFKQWGEFGQMAPLDGQGRFDHSRGVTVADDGTVYQQGDLAFPDGPRYGEAVRAGHEKAHLTGMYRVGKKAAGRELDGRTWDEFPAGAAS